MTSKHDLHLSAYSINQDTISKLEVLGFCRDTFANNRYCDTTAYHATYRGKLQLPDNNFWHLLKALLKDDISFVGGLEEEKCEASNTKFFSNKALNIEKQYAFKPLPLEKPATGTYKKCDIHLNVNLDTTSTKALNLIDSLQLASFDKPESDGTHRIFTVTCESVKYGLHLYDLLCEMCENTSYIDAKIKFEHTQNFLRIPASAPALPFLTDDKLKEWLQ